MKKLFLTTAIILGFVIGSNAQQNTGGLIKRGGDRMTRDDEAGLFLPGDGLHGIGGNADATDTYYDDTEYDWQSHIPEPTEPTPEPTTISGGYWNADSTWQNGEVPYAVDVIINGPVTIPAGYPAYAGDITIADGASLTIEEGGELYHTGNVNVTMQMQITPNLAKDHANYRLIASPVNVEIDNIDETGLIHNLEEEEGMDLYSWNQGAPQEEWRNYKQIPFDIEIGKGYLYYNSVNTDVEFVGNTVPTNEPYPINLTYSDNAQMDEWKGLNLIGNPFTCKATPDRPFYVLNAAGDEVLSDSSTQGFVDPKKGFFVVAENDGEQCQITQYNSNNKAISSLNMSVSQGRDIVDVASLRFGTDQSLLKIQLNPNHTKVYMPVEGKNYAVASAPEMGEMPVSFKAEHNDSYTLSFTSKEVSFNYLHLIDNMTGADVDLLATPSYSFDAKTTDYASRFRLVFATGNNSNDDNFAFINGTGNLGIFGIEGTATLQVMDVLGHMLSSETFSGSYEKQLNVAPGVYMLRLINGNDIKVQKMIVR